MLWDSVGAACSVKGKLRKIKGLADAKAMQEVAREAERQRQTCNAAGMQNAPVTDEERDEGIVLNPGEVHAGSAAVRLVPVLSKVLKPHQIDGVRFMWQHASVGLCDGVNEGLGCILADYMGLGKTIQVLSLLHAFLTVGRSTKCNISAIVLAPATVVSNWLCEVHKWFGESEHYSGQGGTLRIQALDSKVAKDKRTRSAVLRNWTNVGGVLVIGYEQYRLLVQSGGDVQDMLCNGPDIVIADEGHRMRRRSSQLVQTMMKFKTKRRIVLTGYPLQNHLMEYYCMVNFARPYFLATAELFKNRFIIPIENGRAKDR